MDGLTIRKVVGGSPKSASRYKNSFRRALIVQRSKQIADGADSDGVLVTLSLNNDLSSQDGTGIKSNTVNTAITGGLCKSRI
jgi:hypothetical protein